MKRRNKRKHVNRGERAGEKVKGWEPATKPDPVASVNPAVPLRVGDYGDSGQFAPGGYYNQRGVTAPRRIDLDEYTATRAPDEPQESEGGGRPD